MNGVVALLGVLGAVILAGAVIGWLFGRRRADLRAPVQHYRHVLDTLSQLPQKEPGANSATLNAPGETRLSTPEVSNPEVSTRSDGRRVIARSGDVPARKLPVFADAEDGRLEDPVFLPAPKPVRRAQRGLRRPSHDERRASAPRRIGVAVLSGVLVGGLLAGGLYLGRRELTGTKAGRNTTTALPNTSGTDTTTPLPTTTVPVPSTVATNPSEATYAAPTGSYTVVVTITADDCWVQVTDGAGGAVQWSGTLTSGQQQSFPANGPLDVELGAASEASVALNGQVISFPSGFQSPLTLSFVPAAPESSPKAKPGVKS